MQDPSPHGTGVEWSSSRIAALLDVAPDGVVIIDRDGLVAHVNPVALEHLGVPRHHVVGRTDSEFLTAFEGTSIPGRYRALRDHGGTDEFEEFVPILDGWYRFFADADALGDGMLVVFVREVTGHRLNDRRSRLMARVGAAVEPARTMGDTLRATLRAVRGELDFDLVEFWSVGAVRSRLLAIDHDDEHPEMAEMVSDWVVAQGHGPAQVGRELPVWEGLEEVVEVPIDMGVGDPLLLRALRRRSLSDDDSAAVLLASAAPIANVLVQRRTQIEVEQFFELTREYVVIMTDEGRLRRVNPVVAERLGGGSAANLLDVPFEELVHPDDVEDTRANLQLTVATGEPIERLVQRVRSSDGSYRWISWNAQGSVEERMIFTTGRDVTDERAGRLARQALDEALRGVLSGEPLGRTLERLAEVVDALDGVSGCAVVLLDHGDEAGRTPAPTPTLLVTAAPSLPTTFVAALDGCALDSAPGDLPSVLLDGSTVVAARLDADPRWSALHAGAAEHGVDAVAALPLLGADDRPLGMVVVTATTSETLDDIRWERVREVLGLASLAIEAARSVEALALNEERFRIVAEVITDAVFERSADGWWTTDAFESLFGHELPTGGVDDSWWLERVHPDDRSEVVASLRSAVDRGESTWEVEYRFLRGDGGTADVRVRARLLRDRTGGVVNLIGGMLDVTERRELEREYLRALRTESLGTLAGGIAHDLNNSLSPIIMGAELMAEHELDPEAHDLLEMITTAARRSAGMVRNILTYARGIEGPRRVVDLDEVIASAVKLTGDTFPKQIEIVAPSEESGLLVRGDPTQIHQILMNLAVNARDAMPAGGVLTIEIAAVDDLWTDGAHAHAVSIAGSGSGSFVRIRVVDTGTGMTAAVRERAFEPFFTTKARSEGTGLGLPTALSIARAHGGGLSVTSRPGAGTTVDLYLPLLDPALVTEADHSGPLPRPDLGHVAALTVLVVDDEAAVRAMLRQMLESIGHEVIEAADGGEAASVLTMTTVDLVLTDVMMPGVDGVELVTSLRDAGDDVPVIAMTGLTDDRRTLQFPEGSISSMLAKPFDRAALLAAISGARRR